MANIFTYQTLKDTTSQVVIKLTGSFDGTGQESNTVRVVANSLFGALDANGVPLRSILSLSNTAKPFYNMQLGRVWYQTNIPSIELRWSAKTAANAQTIMFISGTQTWSDQTSWPSIPNNANTPTTLGDATGDVGIATLGAAANSAYTIIAEFRKDNRDYQRGQFTDPAAFNFPPFNLKP